MLDTVAMTASNHKSAYRPTENTLNLFRCEIQAVFLRMGYCLLNAGGSGARLLRNIFTSIVNVLEEDNLSLGCDTVYFGGPLLAFRGYCCLHHQGDETTRLHSCICCRCRIYFISSVIGRSVILF